MIALFLGGAAEKAGLHSGDKIIKVRSFLCKIYRTYLFIYFFLV